MLNWLFKRYVYIIFDNADEYTFKGVFSSEKKAKKHILFLNEVEYNDVNDYIIEKCQVF